MLSLDVSNPAQWQTLAMPFRHDRKLPLLCGHGTRLQECGERYSQGDDGLVRGVLEWSHANGYSEVATVTDLRFERTLGRPGLPFSRLGTPHPMETTTAIVGIIPATIENVLRVRPKGYEPFFVDRAPLAA